MKLLFVRSNKIGSRLIRWALRTDCSHFAVCFDEDAHGGGIVFHSYGTGARLEWLGEFLRHFTVVHALEFKTPMALQDEEAIYKGLVAQYSGQGYDYKALLFWAWRGLLLRLLGVPLPIKNAWAVAGYNLCTGLAAGVKWIAQWAYENRVDLEMVKPHDLMVRLVETEYFVPTSTPGW